MNGTKEWLVGILGSARIPIYLFKISTALSA